MENDTSYKVREGDLSLNIAISVELAILRVRMDSIGAARVIGFYCARRKFSFKGGQKEEKFTLHYITHAMLASCEPCFSNRNNNNDIFCEVPREPLL